MDADQPPSFFVSSRFVAGSLKTEATEWICGCKPHLWLALNNINTVFSLILCMFFCVGVEVHMLLFFYFIFIFFPINSSAFVLICSSEDDSAGTASSVSTVSAVAQRYPATILQLTPQKNTSLEIYLSIYMNKELKDDISVRADFPVNLRMFYSPRLSTVCF